MEIAELITTESYPLVHLHIQWIVAVKHTDPLLQMEDLKLYLS